jgi:hypothetical protein
MQLGMTGGSGGWRRGYGFLLGATAFAVAAADWLFYGHPVGWTAGLFAFVVMALLAVRGGAFLRAWPGRAVTLAAGGLVAALVEEPTPLAVVMASLAVAMLAVLNCNRWPGGARQWAARLAEAVGVGLTRVVTDNRVAVRWMGRHPQSLAGPVRAARLWVLPVVLGCGFVLLFRAANPVISSVVGRALASFGDALRTIGALVDLPRNVFWLIVAAVVYALLRVRRCRRREIEVVPQAATMWRDEADALAGARRSAFARAVVVRCLVVFNALFAVQNLLDVMYLFGGAALPEGMSHAEYAHRGAYPLVATALLAAVFVLAAFRPGGAAEQSALARRLVYVWVAQNVFLTITAAWRLDLYVGIYSLTRLRVAAGVWMMLVAAGLVWVGCRIVFRRDNGWLLNANVLTAVAVLYVCCFVNFDRVIADYNVAHCRETGGGGVSIDVDYLRTLGPDALPALRRLAPLLPPAERRRETLAHVEALEQELRDDLSDWRGWTLRRARLGRGAVDARALALRELVGVTLVSPLPAREAKGDTSVAPTKTLTSAHSRGTGRGGSPW